MVYKVMVPCCSLDSSAVTSFSTLHLYTHGLADVLLVLIGRWVAKYSDWLCGKWRPL